MELEYTWGALGTTTGCTAATLLITQYLKEYLPKWMPTRLFVLALSFIMLTGAWGFTSASHNLSELPLILVNSFSVAFAAMGAYETVKPKEEILG